MKNVIFTILGQLALMSIPACLEARGHSSSNADTEPGLGPILLGLALAAALIAKAFSNRVAFRCGTAFHMFHMFRTQNRLPSA
jgi:hypothetical protein